MVNGQGRVMTRSPIAAAILAAALIAPAATASDYYDRDVQTTLVSVGDLDLTTGWGMDRLIKRLRGRIDDMCGWDEDCRDEAWLSADWQVARAVTRDQSSPSSNSPSCAALRRIAPSCTGGQTKRPFSRRL